MSDLHVRLAHPLDATAMARLLNRIIATGGTTAITDPVTAEEIAAWVTDDSAVWHVAEIAGDIVGFQWIEPSDALPPDAVDIATFVQEGRHGTGIGSALFAATERTARDRGHAWINANIRADNSGGLIYYQSRGFRDWHRVPAHRLANGQIVAKIWKRYDLD